jgi:hypothetical protein
MLGFVRCPVHPCLYKRVKEAVTILLGVHVDDGLMGCSDDAAFDQFFEEFERHVQKATITRAIHKYTGITMQVKREQVSQHNIKNNSAEQVGPAILDFVNAGKLKEYDIQVIKSDGEGAVAVLKEELMGLGVNLDIAGPGQHVPRVENKIQHAKKKVRSFYHVSFLMPRHILIGCVMCLQPEHRASEWAQ